RQLRDVAREPVVEGTKDGERADTKDETRGDERLAQRRAGACQPALQPITEASQPRFQVDGLTDEDADEQSGEKHQWILRRDGTQDSDQHREEANRSKECLMHSLRQAIADECAQDAANQHRQRVEQRTVNTRKKREHVSILTSLATWHATLWVSRCHRA